MGIPDFALQIRDKLHIHIEHPTALQASDMMVLMTAMVKTIGARRDFQIADFPVFRQLLQISKHRAPTDGRVFRNYGGVDLVRGGMAL